MKYHTVDIRGFQADLPILPLPSGISIAFFNLHGDQALTEHCAKELAKELGDCDVLITAESKGLQLTHCVARELGQRYYAVARKTKKLYMQDGIEITIESSITTGKEQKMYLSKHDVDLIKGKKVGEEAIEKIEFYLKNDTIRDRIAYSGFQKVMNGHTYSDRVEVMCSFLEEYWS